MRLPAACRLLPSALGLAGALSAQVVTGPVVVLPMEAGIDYKIVAVKMPRAPSPEDEKLEYFPDAANRSLYIGRNADLVLIHPNGTETVLVDASHVFGAGTGGLGAHPFASCTDPTVSFDGSTVFFSWFEDPQDFNTQRKVSYKPAHIMKVHVASGAVTQLTSGSTVAYADSANAIDPKYARFDVAPVPLPDGRILYLSNQEGMIDTVAKLPAMRFFRMNADGTNNEVIENFTLGACQHPIVLMDGRIVWTHFHPAGRRTWGTGNYPLMVSNPDMSDWKTFAGAHFKDTAWHFTTQLSDGSVVTTVYYHQNNYGHGSLLKMPLTWGTEVQSFGPISASTATYNSYGWPDHVQPQYAGGNDHFPRLGETVVAPWVLDNSLSKDAAAPFLPGTTTRSGKFTMPAGAPGNDLLCVYSPGAVYGGSGPNKEPPHMKVAFIADADAPDFSDLLIVKEDAGYHYMYPKPVVRYLRIYGQAAPDIVPDVPNDGSSLTELTAGSPFATIGTSSVYNRESVWPASYKDAHGPDPWDVNTPHYDLVTAFRNVGQDRVLFSNSRIFAAQVVADMTHFDSRYATLTPRFRTHNNGSQIWGILGEIPLRKRDGSGGVIIDEQNNPDTSYEVRIPADVPVHNRIIDVDGITLTDEATWHAPRPGERKTGCGGCHAHSNDVEPLDFGTTFAASHPITDFAMQTPLVSHTGTSPTVVNHATKIKIVEFFRDVKPILDAKCVRCHGSVSPSGELDLQVDYAGPTITDNVWDRLAYSGQATSLTPHPTHKVHQATRWIRKNSAGQSLFVWKAYDKRLDGRADGDRPNDVDFGAAHPTSLTFDERRILAMWVDLGCLVDEDPDASHVWDCFDDQMPPTLAVQGIDWNNATWPLGVLRVGVYDLHSGIKPGTLDLTATDVATGLPFSGSLSLPTLTTDGVYQVDLSPLTAGVTWRIDIMVEDLAAIPPGHGNRTRRSYTVHL